jgi:glutamine synthetase
VKRSRMQEIETVVVAMTDMQGRLQGKRFHARFFLDEVAAHGTEACAYLLAVDTDMNTVDGYEPVRGNAYAVPGLPRVPASLDEALELWSSSALAAEAYGKDVVDHYSTMARVELDAYRRAVTDWELRRYFERI